MRSLRSDVGITETGVPYIIMERLFGWEVDARSDQYALAMISYEMLAVLNVL